MIEQTSCDLDCACASSTLEPQWSEIRMIAMEPQADGSTLVTLECAPTPFQPGLRVKTRLRAGSLTLRARFAAQERQQEPEWHPLHARRLGVAPPPRRLVNAEIAIRGVATRIEPHSGIYLTTEVMRDGPGPADAE